MRMHINRSGISKEETLPSLVPDSDEAVSRQMVPPLAMVSWLTVGLSCCTAPILANVRTRLGPTPAPCPQLDITATAAFLPREFNELRNWPSCARAPFTCCGVTN